MMQLPTINMTATGRNIIRLREQNGMTVKDLQDIFAFSTPNAIYKWQRGIAVPTLDNLIVLAAVFRVTVDDILVIDVPEDQKGRTGKR